MSKIQQFYAGQKIFVTGGTGFLGKTLIEKLLRSCPDIDTIYMLIRAKKEKSAEERIEAFRDDPVFEVLRVQCPEFSKKIIGIHGDSGEKGLGLSATDYARIVDEVTVIFHLAATVRFNEKLDKAVALNVDSVKTIVEIARACKKLKVGVHVSTAYSNCVKKSIDERFYPPPLSYEGIHEVLDDIGKREWTEKEITDFTESVLGDWPNSYSFTKAIAEGVIEDFGTDLPLAVFRPSIVVNAYREPIPGWVFGPFGLAGLICGIGIGVVRVILMDTDITLDIVPVDYVCNSLITCAWKTAINKRRPNEDIPIYNYVSGVDNPSKFGELQTRVDIMGRGFPTNSAVYYPNGIMTKSAKTFDIAHIILHLIPAFLVDSIGKLFGKQLGMYKLARKLGGGIRAVAYFTTQEWDFGNQRVKDLWTELDPIDKLLFPFDIKNVDWDVHMLKMIKGLRRYLICEPDSNQNQARRRQQYLHIIHTIIRLIFGAFVLWIIWKVFCGRSFTIGTEIIES